MDGVLRRIRDRPGLGEPVGDALQRLLLQDVVVEVAQVVLELLERTDESADFLLGVQPGEELEQISQLLALDP